jgi:hypothetical protein
MHRKGLKQGAIARNTPEKSMSWLKKAVEKGFDNSNKSAILMFSKT